MKTITDINKSIMGLESDKAGIVKQMTVLQEDVTKNIDNMTEKDAESKASMIKDATKDLESLTKQIDMLNIEKQDLRKSIDSTIPSTLNYMRLNKEEARKNLADSPEFLEAYAKSIRGDNSEYKTLVSNETTGNGGFGDLVPTLVSDTIQRRLADNKNLLAYANVTTLPGLVRLTIEATSTGASLHPENSGAVAEEEITLKSVLTEPAMVKKMITWTDELEIMSAVSLVTYLVNEFLDKIITKIEDGMVNGALTSDGEGLNGIIEIAKTSPEYVATNTGAGVMTYADLLKMLGEVKGNDQAFFMNRKTFYSEILGMVDTTGKPILTSISDNKGITHSVLGTTVYFNDALKPYLTATATDTVIILQSKGAYKINAPKGLTPTYVLDETSMAHEDKKRLVGKVYLGGRPALLEGMAILNKGTVPVPA